jgi:hypothetical protein
MKFGHRIVCAALAVASAACTIGPATDSGGGGSSTTNPSLGDQCTELLSDFCQKVASCAFGGTLQDCIDSYMAECCTGSACTVTSTVSEATASECEQEIAAEDCSITVEMASGNPASCLAQ